jgi:hypothetical protein
LATMAIPYILVHLFPHLIPIVLSIQKIKRCCPSWVAS